MRRFACLLPLLLVLAPIVQAKPPEIARDDRNPPPPVALATYDRFDVRPVAMADDVAAHKGNRVARQYLQVDLDERMPKLIAPWNARGPGDRILSIRPTIEQIRFITGGKRLLAGGFAGNSWALVRLDLVDLSTGEVIATPRFYQRAPGIFAGYSLGAADKLMLARIADMAAAYLHDNYEIAQGSNVARASRAMD
ncbi:hypothetical protein [Lysobacter xanthus]